MKNDTKNILVQRLKENDPAKVSALFAEADAVRREYMGDCVYLRGIIEFSNICARDCHYCGLRASNAKLSRYTLSRKEIMESVAVAKEFEIGTVVLQAGEGSPVPIKELCSIVTEISGMGMAVTLSAGELPFDDYKALREAGADRYLLKFETSNEKLYKKFRPWSELKDRLECIENLKKLGFQAGSGNLVGFPGQTDEDLADDILLCKELELDMVSISVFLPHPETPLKGVKKPVLEKMLKTLALARIVTLNTHMPATTAAGTMDPLGREKALQCGANVIMPNVSPSEFRKLYEIYPDKICTNEGTRDCYPCLTRRIESVGRTVGKGRGDSVRKGLTEKSK